MISAGYIYLNNPCQTCAEWSQGGVDFWFDIAVKFAHNFQTFRVHIENRKLNNLLYFQGYI